MGPDGHAARDLHACGRYERARDIGWSGVEGYDICGAGRGRAAWIDTTGAGTGWVYAGWAHTAPFEPACCCGGGFDTAHFAATYFDQQ